MRFLTVGEVCKSTKNVAPKKLAAAGKKVKMGRLKKSDFGKMQK
jgi:hypothetical protein